MHIHFVKMLVHSVIISGTTVVMFPVLFVKGIPVLLFVLSHARQSSESYSADN
jgi:hypothetical protein